MPQVALDKKSNFEYLEKEVGLKRFLPKSVIEGMKVRMIIGWIFILQNTDIYYVKNYIFVYSNDKYHLQLTFSKCCEWYIYDITNTEL